MNAIDLHDVMPSPQADDDAEIREALSTARMQWATGQRDDALRSLRRAAEFANEREHDHRALDLFKIAATLRSSLVPPPPSGSAIADRKVPPSSAPAPRLPPRPARLSALPKALPPPPRSNVRQMPPRNIAPPSPSRPTATLQAVRVAVSRVGGELRIVPMTAGAAAPPNAVIALLVPTAEADADAMLALLAQP